MAVFAVLGLNNLEKLGESISRNYPIDSLMVSSSHWFVVDSGTSKEVSDKLGISEGQVADAVILGIQSYWGRAPNIIWEWLQSRLTR